MRLASTHRVISAAPLAMPEGYSCVRDDVWAASPEVWTQTFWPQGVSVAPLSLHELFLAHARTDAPKSAA